MEAKLLIDGRWIETVERIEVTNKYSGEVIGTVPRVEAREIEAAIQAASKASKTMAGQSAWARSEILHKAAQLIRERKEDLAQTIAAEAGKALKFSLGEVDRAIQVFTLAAEEAKRLHGETLPLDAVPNGQGYFGFWTRRPVGVVAAITPFNRQSGLGREGVRFAMEDMTNIQMVAIRAKTS